MRGIGHNNGPTLEAGYAFRKFAWTKARADLLPTLPIEILRVRVARAKALGLPYRTYASVRASTGRDVVGFLFSNNALRVLRDVDNLPADRLSKLRAVEAAHTVLVHAPLPLAAMARAMKPVGDDSPVIRAPHFAQSWSAIRDAVTGPLIAAKLPRDGVLVIGETEHERLWSAAGRLAGYLTAPQYFDQV